MQISPTLKFSHTGSATMSVVSHGQMSLITQLLEDIARLRPSSLAKIIITHNLGEIEDRTLPADLSIPVQFIVNSQKKGFGANHNAAFAFCDTPYFAIVNPDIRLKSDPFDRLIQVMNNESAVLIAPMAFKFDGQKEDNWRQWVTPINIVIRYLKKIFYIKNNRNDKSDWAAGLFMLWDRRGFEAVKGFDQQYYMYCEDMDICLRVYQAGLKIIFCDQVKVLHHARRASKKNLRHLLWHMISMLIFWRKTRLGFKLNYTRINCI